jgi:hypothetical protein
MKSIFNKGWNRDVAIELANCAIRLDYWLSKNEKCVNCTKGSGKKFPKHEWHFQAGKLYAYLYCLENLGYARFLHPWASLPNYTPVTKDSWDLDNGNSVKVFIESTLFDDALAAMAPQLEKDIRKYRARRKYTT